MGTIVFYGAVHIEQRNTSKETIANVNTIGHCEMSLCDAKGKMYNKTKDEKKNVKPLIGIRLGVKRDFRIKDEEALFNLGYNTSSKRLSTTCQ